MWPLSGLFSEVFYSFFILFVMIFFWTFKHCCRTFVNCVIAVYSPKGICTVKAVRVTAVSVGS